MAPSIFIPLHIQLAVAHTVGGLGPGEEVTVGVQDEAMPGLTFKRLLPSLEKAQSAGLIELSQNERTITVSLKNKNP